MYQIYNIKYNKQSNQHTKDFVESAQQLDHTAMGNNPQREA